MVTLYCGECRSRFEPDVDHVRVDVTHMRIDDRNREEAFVFCPACWHDLADEWGEPV